MTEMSFDSSFAYTEEPLESAAALERRLRAIGAARYHDLHPFHDMLHGGRLDLGQVQARTATLHACQDEKGKERPHWYS